MRKFKVLDETYINLYSENVLAECDSIEECFKEIALMLTIGSDRFSIRLPNNALVEVDARYCNFGSWEE